MTADAPKFLTVPLGVTLARQPIDNPWQDHVWLPVSVFLGAPPVADWRLLEVRDGIEHYHAATLDLDLHRKETAGYIANLIGDAPGVYVVIRPGSADGCGSAPVHVHLVTLSAHDIEAYGHLGDEIIGRVAMPDDLRALLEAFIDAHHVEEPFRKRKRDGDAPREEPHQFGQEPIHILRARMQQARVRSSQDRPE